MKLYCIRHGHAENVALDDHGRKLTEEGRVEMERMARYLNKCKIQVSQIIHSGKLRAKESAEIIAKYLAPEQITESSSLLGTDKSVIPLMEMLHSWQDDTMLVGHLPFLSQLISALLLSDENYDAWRFVPATVICVERYKDSQWMMNWMLCPEVVIDS